MSRPNHTLNLILAIVATIFCCLPLGVVAIVFAAIGMSREGSGNYAGAESAARISSICYWIAIGIGLVSLVGYAVLALLVGVPFLFDML